MRLRVMLLAALTIGAVPVAVLAGLAAGGFLASGPALVAAAIVVAAALGLAIGWANDLDRLVRMIVRASRDGGMPEVGPAAPEMAAPMFPPTRQVAREIDRLSRIIAERTALVGRMRRADEVVVERLPDPLIVLGADRSVRRANAASRAVFGTDVQAVLRHPRLRAAIDTALSSRSTQLVSITLAAPVMRDLHATVIFMDPPLADGGEAVVVLSDRTQTRAVERMRVDFVANASHELRTPLASLIGFIDTLLGPAADDPPAQRRFLGIMAEQAARMNRLIDDLLSLSRVELTEHQAPSETIALPALLSRIAASFEPQLRQSGSTLTTALPTGLPNVIGDADQLTQVAQNLLDNAVKYGRAGGTIRLSVEVAPPGGRWPFRPGVLIRVSDEGPGIAREHISRLTERFYRIDKGRSRSVGGTGLGLAIVKHIVTRHRGQLLIESTVGEGTSVTVWLPVAGPSASSPEGERADRQSLVRG